MKGKFIVFEGIDGAGTTTQARLLEEHLARAGWKVCGTAEPSTGSIGALARELFTGRVAPLPPPRAMALLFIADRLAHVERVIARRLEQGFIVICDRYLWSTFVYQDGVFERSLLEKLHEGLPVPDLTVFLRVSPAVAKRRRVGRIDDVYEVDEVQERVALGYDREAEAAGLRDENLLILDGGKSEAEVAADVRSVFARGLP